MKKYFLALLLVSVAHANDDDIDITPMLEKYAASNPVQPLPEVIAPIEYDLLKSKWGKANWYVSSKCQDPMNLTQQCKSPLQLKYDRFIKELKAHKVTHEKPYNDRFRNIVNQDKCNDPNSRCSQIRSARKRPD